MKALNTSTLLLVGLAGLCIGLLLTGTVSIQAQRGQRGAEAPRQQVGHTECKRLNLRGGSGTNGARPPFETAIPSGWTAVGVIGTNSILICH